MTDLFEAIERGREDDVSRFLDADPNSLEKQKDAEPWLRPLQFAAFHGWLGMARLLIEREANIHATAELGRTALHWAAEAGHEEVVGLLLSHGAEDVVVTDEFGSDCALVSAAAYGHLGVVKMLLPHMGGQGLDEADEEGMTALHLAAQGGYEGILRALLLAGADGTITDDRGRTPLAIAHEIQHQGCVEVFEWWEGELERRYFLQRARCLHDAFMEPQATPTAPVPAFLQDRKATSQALPQVEVVARQQEEQQVGPSGQEGASIEAGSPEEGEEVHAVLAHVVGQLNEQLFTELVQCFHASEGGSNIEGRDSR